MSGIATGVNAVSYIQSCGELDPEASNTAGADTTLEVESGLNAVCCSTDFPLRASR